MNTAALRPFLSAVTVLVPAAFPALANTKIGLNVPLTGFAAGFKEAGPKFALKQVKYKTALPMGEEKAAS